MSDTKAYTVYASTGCSCCNSDNHYRGPYRSKQDAEEAVKSFQQQHLVASQYSQQGNYDIEEHDAEVLPDGRVIIGSRIFGGFVGDENSTDDYIGREMTE